MFGTYTVQVLRKYKLSLLLLLLLLATTTQSELCSNIVWFLKKILDIFKNLVATQIVGRERIKIQSLKSRFP